MKRRTSLTLFILFALLVTLPIIIGVSFESPVTINSGLQVFTDDDIVCSWNYSVTTEWQNITIYRNGAVFYNTNQSGTLDTSYTVDSGDSAKNQQWVCNITLHNSTTIASDAYNVTIQNSAPATPVITDTGHVDIGTEYNLSEDQSYTFNATSSDLDSDTLYYYFKSDASGLCSMTDNDEGIASCQASGNYTSLTEWNVTYWVDDDDVLKAKSASLKITYTIVPSNDDPVLTLSNQTTYVNETIMYNFTATDEEGNFPLNFTFQTLPAEIASKTSIDLIGPSRGRITYNASSPDYNDVNASGWYIVVNATDSDGGSTTAGFYLIIQNAGREPTITNVTPASPYARVQGGSVQINITAYDPDPDENLTFTTNDSMISIQKIRPLNPPQNATGSISFTATNDDVGLHDVLVTVTDLQLYTNATVLRFNITNVNDQPTLNENSSNAANTAGTSIRNLTGYVDVWFVYYVNGTDPDTPYGDALTYSDNTSLFDINTTTGLVRWYPTSANADETYLVNFSLVDTGGLRDWMLSNITILNNTIPYFNGTIETLICQENQTCTYDLSINTTDDDLGDYIDDYALSFVGSSLTSFSYNSTSGLVNFTPAQTELSNYTLNITITDTRGATATRQWNLTVLNTEDTPILTRWDFSGSTIVETHPFTYQLQATDNDLRIINGTENVTFTTNLSFINITYQTTVSDTAYALLYFTPGAGEVGTQGIEINVTDSTGRTDSERFTFVVRPDTEAPAILNIRPYGNNSNNSWITEAFINTSNAMFGGGTIANVTLQENHTYRFDHITNDDNTTNASLSTWWFYDDVLNSTDWSLDLEFGYYSSGGHTLQLVVGDEDLENSTWNWSLTVQNLNRGPQLITSLDSPKLVNETTIFNNYFLQTDSNTHFIDPDDDINGDNQISGSESSSLTITALNACDYADLTITGMDLRVSPTADGTCLVTFQAFDSSSATVNSNTVSFNISFTDEGNQETQTVNQPSGGGGSSTSRSSYVPITEETEVPHPLSLLAPGLVTIYDNETVTIPITIKNTWSEDLEYIQFGMESNDTYVRGGFSSNIIETLAPNASKEVLLVLSDYRLGGNYEVVVNVNVSNPAFSDSVEIILAAIEHASPGEVLKDAMKVKVTFARDLFNENPECQELNELLDRANEALANDNVQQAKMYVDSAINGCKYVVSQLNQQVEEPALIPSSITIDDLTFTTLLYIALAFIVLVTVAFIIYYHYTSREEDDI